MSKDADLVAKFWKDLKSDRTIMLGIDGVEDGHTRPMTAQVVDDRSPIWFFTSKDNALVQRLGGRAIASFSSKGHDLFATIHGRLTVDTDRAVIDRLWNKFIAAWFDGKDDPKLRLLRFDPRHAQIWLNENSLFAGVKLMLGADPKKDYADKVADVRLD